MNDEESQKYYELAARLMSEQNLTAAVIAGAVATVLAAVAYGVVVEAWPFSYGFAAAGVGIVIGLSMGFVGRGISAGFAVAAAMFTIAGCLLGNLFVVVIGLAKSTARSPIDVFRTHSLAGLIERSMSGFSLIDLVYWLIAVACAVFFARRPLSRADRLAIGLHAMRK